MDLSKHRLNSAFAILALIVAVSASLVTMIFRQDNKPPSSDYVVKVAQLWGAPMINVALQTAAYKMFLIGLFLASVAMAFASVTRTFACSPCNSAMSHFLFRLSSIPRILPWLTPFLWVPLMFAPRATTFGAADGLFTGFTVMLASTAILTAILSHLPSGILRYLSMALIALYAGMLLLPGLLSPILLESYQLRGVDWHFESVIGAGEQLGIGLDVFREIRPPYGILGPALVGILHRIFGPLDFLTHVRIIQISQFIFFLLALISYKLWLRKHVGIWFLGALLIGPWVSSVHDAVLYPNQSGWRFWCLALGVIALLLSKSRPIGNQAVLLGLTLGLTVLSAPELSIVLGIGYAAHLAIRLRVARFNGVGKTLVKFSASVLVVLAAYFCVHFVFFGGFPLNFGRIFATVRHVSQSGFSGSLMYYDPTALCVLILASYRCSLITLRFFQNRLGRHDDIQIAISIIALVWLNYFVNRADPWNLWTQIYLLPFLLPRGLWASPALRLARPPRRVGLNGSGLSLCLGRQFFIISFLIAPIILGSNKLLISNTIVKWQNKSSGTSQYLSTSGLMIPNEISTHLQVKCVDALNKTTGKVFCLTKLPYTTRLQLKAEPRIWVSNPFISWPEAGLNTFCNYIEDSDYHTLLIDAGGEPMGILDPTLSENWSFLVRKFKSKLKDHFDPVGMEGGWEIWKRKPNHQMKSIN